MQTTPSLSTPRLLPQHNARSQTPRSRHAQKAARWQQTLPVISRNAPVKELVTDANFECNEEGIVLQAMYNSHIAPVSIPLRQAHAAGGEPDLAHQGAQVREGRHMHIEGGGRGRRAESDSNRIAEYDMKLMDIDADTFTIPETPFTRIVRDLSQLGESVRIEVLKEGVRFASDGEAANRSVLLRQSDRGHVSEGTIKPKVEDGAEGSGEADEAKEEDKDEEGGGKAKKAKKLKIKKEKAEEDIEMVEDDDEDEDEESFKRAD
ncbi:hypothetical protein CVT25_014672 [Psilocybe cyanescens]|uniref:Proliferating cell nuclear antigen PCNA C-terminal domain-containing protein n=1 Tax=Psilocybe cyanescens TaxID=93625 RepID=A0A409X901_PSICY|nr:hypothetical protein CVT25_014672 [Psilocybe cyanescens]